MSATTDDTRAHLADLVNLARTRADELDDGPIKAALSDEYFDKIEHVTRGDVSGLTSWPPLFLRASRSSPEQLRAFQAALQRVHEHTPADKRHGLGTWLTSDASDPGARAWRGGLFELAMKDRFLRGAANVEFDALLPNGRDMDIAATVAGRRIFLEATVVTESDEDQSVWNRFAAAHARGEDAVLVRPGKHDARDAKGPSPYYDTMRIYSKVFDKLAKNGNPAKPQLSEDAPNALLVSVWTGHGTPYVSSPGIGWALDELFVDQPNMGAVKERTPSGLHDVSLSTFLKEGAPDHAHALLQSPRRLGGIILFNETRMHQARLNYNAIEPCRLGHAEMAAIEQILTLPLDWT